MVAAGPARNVDVFAQLDVTLGAQNDGAAIAPAAEAIRGEPVGAEVVRGAIVGHEGGVAEIFQLPPSDHGTSLFPHT